jgi:DNA-binding helix-hairpin-helix protein with protein kinase domain
MRLKIAVVALVALAVVAPAASAGGITLRIETRERQTARELNVKVTCVDDPCTAEVTGKARVGTRRFAIRPKERSLAADETERFELRVRRLRRLEKLLVERDGKAVVKVRGTRADGASTKLKIEITLKG